MKKIGIIILKILGIFIGLLLLLFLGLYLKFNEPLPTGKKGLEADMLANKMLTALNYEAYNNTRYIEWTFKGMHHYKWDKTMGLVEVRWKDVKANIDLNNSQNSTVHKANVLLDGGNKQDYIKQAVAYFNNDSFWVVAPYKVFDKGVVRSIVINMEGQQELLVTYNSGGSTPGDSYLWQLDEFGNPISYKMWVKIIPIGGLEASWDEWKITQTSAKLPSNHTLLSMHLEISNLEGYN